MSARTTRFPYRLYSGQQESGSVGIASRGPNGEITFRDWHPVGAEEYGYVTAAPHDPDIVYGGKLTRYDRRTHQGARAFCPSHFVPMNSGWCEREPVIFRRLNPQPAFLRDQHSVADDRWRAELAGDQPRPEPQDLRSPGRVSANFVTSPPRNRGNVA